MTSTGNGHVHEVTVDVPDGLWMTSNMRLHWARTAERSRGLRYLGLCAVRHVPAMARAHIVCTIAYPGGGRADPANAWPTIKPLVDGMVDAGMLPDDNSHCLIGPDMRRAPHRAPKHHHHITVTIEELYE